MRADVLSDGFPALLAHQGPHLSGLYYPEGTDLLQPLLLHSLHLGIHPHVPAHLLPFLRWPLHHFYGSLCKSQPFASVGGASALVLGVALDLALVELLLL